MKNNSLVLAALASLALAAPVLADGAMGTAKSVAGSTTAFIVDVPEGVVVDSAVKCPVKFTHGLAEAFGDEKGPSQLFVGALLGVPTGMVFGVPYGAIMGGHHAMTKGWEKPFSAESFMVSNEDK